MQQGLKDLDWGGIVLYSSGLTSFVLSLSWGGGLYPWTSYHVLVPLILGFFILVAFALYGTIVANSTQVPRLTVSRKLYAAEVSIDTHEPILEWTIHGAGGSRVCSKRTSLCCPLKR